MKNLLNHKSTELFGNNQIMGIAFAAYMQHTCYIIPACTQDCQYPWHETNAERDENRTHKFYRTLCAMRHDCKTRFLTSLLR